MYLAVEGASSHWPASDELKRKLKNTKVYDFCVLGIAYCDEDLTLSNFCSLLRLARPPQKSEVPRTKRRFERTEPKREYLSNCSLFWFRAEIAIISSVALPNVAFRSPPTAQQQYQIK